MVFRKNQLVKSQVHGMYIRRLLVKEKKKTLGDSNSSSVARITLSGHYPKTLPNIKTTPPSIKKTLATLLKKHYPIFKKHYPIWIFKRHYPI